MTGQAKTVLTHNEFGLNRRAAPARHQTRQSVAGSVTSDVLRRIEQDICWAVRLLARLPGGAIQGVGSQLGKIVQSADDGVTFLPTAADITRADRIYASVIDCIPDPFDRRLVLGRAAREPWADLIARDPARRTRQQLALRYRQAIVTIHFSEKSYINRK